MQINDGTIFWIIILAGVFLVFKIDNAIKFLIISSSLTTIAAFNINNNSILVMHIAFLICLIKFCMYTYNNGISVSINKCMYFFAIWCLITIPFSLLHGKTIVHNVDGLNTYVEFNFQQITQYGYLFIGLLTCIMCNSLLIANKISLKAIEKCLEISYVLSLSIALLQHVLPLTFVNTYLRNAVHVGYNYGQARISGTFFEASMLSLYCAPLFGGYLYRFLSGFKLKYLIFSLLFIIVTLDSNSSSGVIGILLSIFLIFVISLKSNKKISKNNLFLKIIFLVIGAIFVIYFSSSMMSGIDTLTDKINGIGVSGSARLYAFKYHFELAFSNIIPTGFGTVRSYDLLSTWLCSIGILGLILYLIPVIVLTIKLFKIQTTEASVLFINIIIHNIIMMISVPEFSFLSIWIYYGAAYYMVGHTQRREITDLRLNKA